jgi:DNA repair ATPase RecN
MQLVPLRRGAAGALRGDVTNALSSLAMEGSRFDVSLAWEEICSVSSVSETDTIGIGTSPAGNLLSPSAPSRVPSVRVAAATEVGEREGAHFRVRDGGLDRVTFLLAAGPHEPLRSMGAIASGGEKARLMLALKLAPAMRAEESEMAAAPVPGGGGCDDDEKGLLRLRELLKQKQSAGNRTTRTGQEAANSNAMLISGGVSIFDELDSGVGARIGARIGAALQRLASKGGQQVLCVTHLPQVGLDTTFHNVILQSKHTFN